MLLKLMHRKDWRRIDGLITNSEWISLRVEESELLFTSVHVITLIKIPVLYCDFCENPEIWDSIFFALITEL